VLALVAGHQLGSGVFAMVRDLCMSCVAMANSARAFGFRGQWLHSVWAWRRICHPSCGCVRLPCEIKGAAGGVAIVSSLKSCSSDVPETNNVYEVCPNLARSATIAWGARTPQLRSAMRL
jgi:hypothetical protein